MKNFNYKLVFLGLFLIAIGVIVGIAIRHYHNLPLAESINIVDLGTLVATVFLAVYIPAVLDREKQASRDKKALITSRIEDLQTLYRKINMLVQKEIEEKDIENINNTLDVCQHRFGTIISLIKASNFKTKFTKEIEEIDKVSKEHAKLLLNLDIKGYTSDVKKAEEVIYNKIDQKTSFLIFKTNGA